MIEDIDIYRAAKIIIKRHGVNACYEAQEQINRLEKTGDEQGISVWKRICEAINWLSSQQREAYEIVH